MRQLKIFQWPEVCQDGAQKCEKRLNKEKASPVDDWQSELPRIGHCRYACKGQFWGRRYETVGFLRENSGLRFCGPY